MLYLVLKELRKLRKLVKRQSAALTDLRRLLVADQAALDAAIGGLTSALAAEQAAIDAIVAKVGTLPGAPDFTAEVAQLSDAQTQVQNATTEIQNALAPPAAPTG